MFFSRCLFTLVCSALALPSSSNSHGHSLDLLGVPILACIDPFAGLGDDRRGDTAHVLAVHGDYAAVAAHGFRNVGELGGGRERETAGENAGVGFLLFVASDGTRRKRASAWPSRSSQQRATPTSPFAALRRSQRFAVVGIIQLFIATSYGSGATWALPPILSPIELLRRAPPPASFCCTRTSGGSKSSSTFEMNTCVNHSGSSSTQRGQFSLKHSLLELLFGVRGAEGRNGGIVDQEVRDAFESPPRRAGDFDNFVKECEEVEKPR